MQALLNRVDRLARAFRLLPGTARGALWMFVACACFSGMNGVVRHLVQDLPVFVVVFFRSLFGLLAMLPFLLRPGLASLRPARPMLHGLRAVIGLVAMACWFHALGRMPLANATALSFTMPLFASIAAVLVLGETMRARRWTAVAVGFAGAMIILRPGFAAVTGATLLVLLSALLMAANQTVVKRLARDEHANAIVFWLVLLMTPASLAPALLVWRTPDPGQFAWLAALGAVATVGHQCMVRALAATDATAIYPFDFTRLIFAALIGYAAFGEVPDAWTWAGAAVIASSAIYIARREAYLRRRRRAGDTPPRR